MDIRVKDFPASRKPQPIKTLFQLPTQTKPIRQRMSVSVSIHF
jgi:hypothetical protein